MAGSHLAVGLAAWAWAAPKLGLATYDPASLALAAAGSLLPDVDHPGSWVGRRVRPVSDVVCALLGRRGFTHALIVVALCAAALRHHGPARGLLCPLAVGYLSHLAADLLTPRGLRLAWPLPQGFALPLCRTGSPAEVLVVVGLLAWTALRLAGAR